MANNIAARVTTSSTPRTLLVGILLLAGAARLSAQHEDMAGMTHDSAMRTPLGIPHTRMGSGSAWLPDAATMRAYHWMRGRWTMMLHGDLDLVFNRQFSERGAAQIASTNWLMFMAMHASPSGRGLLHLHAMASAEPLTVGGRGYPLLLQSGETWQGVPLHDRQHPHDLFVELVGMYEYQVSRRFGVSLYGGPVGEPALGPVAYMHRPSAESDPLAPIAHHWQDATHITYGVLTAGVFTRSAKLEGSWFNGREPDEQRYDLDLRRPDSWSVRLLVNPAPRWSGSASYGFLKSPDRSDSLQSERRFGASLLYTRPLPGGGAWSTALIWGASRHQRTSHSVTVETNFQLSRGHSVFGRGTWVQKSAEDLAVPGVPLDRRYGVSSVSAGYVRDLGGWRHTELAAGVRATLNFVPVELESVYGTRRPAGLVGFIRLRPAVQP